jgi:hypothetical protein
MNVLKTLEKLPEICASRNLTDDMPIMIRRGVRGYYPAPPSLDVAGFNARHNITEKQRTAMEIGSMFGWEVPGADPDNV